MARYGSERIRGHGIPEAIEAILINGSRVEPKVALLKPLSSAISIGSGGPFGAEGPIIMTGGAFGSLIAQFFHLTSAERKTLLVAGAAAGMSATFAAPVAAVLLAVELLLFEWKPRSLDPGGARQRHRGGAAPPHPRAWARSSRCPPHPAFIGPAGLLGCVARRPARGRAVGAADAGGLRIRRRVPAPADSLDVVAGHRRPRHRHRRLPLPAGARRRLRRRSARCCRATCRCTRDRRRARREVDDLGGLARLGHLGRRARAAADDWRRARRRRGAFLPAEGAGFWPLVSMGAILGGTMRSPLTGVVFALELTHDINMLLPLLVAVTVAHGFTCWCCGARSSPRRSAGAAITSAANTRSIRSKSSSLREVVRTSVVALPADATPRHASRPARSRLARARAAALSGDRPDRRLVGVITRGTLQAMGGRRRHAGARSRSDGIRPVVAYAGRATADDRLPDGRDRPDTIAEISRRDGTLVGMIALTDLLKARARILDAEHRRERVLGARLRLPAVFGAKSGMFSAEQLKRSEDARRDRSGTPESRRTDQPA